MKKILIVGGSGFIGRSLGEYLKKKKIYNIYMPSSKELNAVDEKQVENYLKRNFFDVIIHAAVHNPVTNIERKSQNMLEYSLRMFYNFERLQNYYGKMFYMGSGAEYGKQGDIIDYKEEKIGERIPDNDYGLMKYIINDSIRKSINIYNIRLFGIYGRYEEWKYKFISNICCKAIKNVPITIRQNVYFDYLYINDFCRIMEWFIENSPKYRDYNVVTGKKIDLFSLAEKVLEISNKKLPIYVCKEGLANEYSASNERLMKEIKNFNYTDVDIAIGELYDWYLIHESELDIYPLLYQ